MALKTEYIKHGEELYEIIPPIPTETERGGIIASPKTDDDTVEAKIGEDGKLYVNVSGGAMFVDLNPTAPSDYLTNLGISADNTLTEIFLALPVPSVTYINTCAQSTPYSNCLPVQSGGVLTIKKGESGQGQLQFDALDTGLSYSTYCKDFVVSTNWKSNDWEQNSVASGWGSGFDTLTSFWEYVENYMYKNASSSCMMKVKINSGCFSNGFTGWCCVWCSSQNPINSTYDVTGSIILVDGSDNVCYGKINGGKGDASTLVDTWQEFITSAGLFDKIYPIGSIYMSVNNTNPSSLFGGTWVAWGAGRVPVGMGSNGTTNYSTVEATGGAESRSHSHAAKTSGAATGNTGAASGNTGATTLTVNQIPSHTHRSADKAYVDAANNNPKGATRINSVPGGGRYFNTYSYDGEGTYTHATGGGSSHTHTLNSHTHTLNSHTHSVPASDSKSTDVRQPYITCYMWKRTA